MGKKPQRHSWPEAKKLCRLNQDDIAMAKRLGFGPDSLIRNRPDPKQKWKLPVKYWIRKLHEERFGHILGEKPQIPAGPPSPIEYSEEEARRFAEELYWEDYRERNAEVVTKKLKPGKPRPEPVAKADGMRLKLMNWPTTTGMFRFRKLSLRFRGPAVRGRLFATGCQHVDELRHKSMPP
jgi:hypothetical protein